MFYLQIVIFLSLDFMSMWPTMFFTYSQWFYWILLDFFGICKDTNL